MYTIISATNRKGSNTLKVAKHYKDYLDKAQIDSVLYTLEDFSSLTRDTHFEKVEKDILIPTQKFIFIMPEYNGSFPGIFKLMIDISDVRQCWNHKKVMLVGIANGRAGNLRGLDVMTNMCHYMKMNVYHDKLPLSAITNELENDVLKNHHTLEAIQKQIQGFLNF